MKTLQKIIFNEKIGVILMVKGKYKLELRKMWINS